jgi:TonB family protein
MIRATPLVVTVLLAVGHNGLAQTAETPNAAIALHQRVSGCDLAQKGTLVFEDRYAFVQVDGVPEQIYSPELNGDDYVGYPPGTPAKLTKLAQKSGFRTKPVPDSAMGELPAVLGSSTASNCPGLEEALRTAAEDRAERRHRLQSKVFRPGFDGVSPPDAVATPQPKSESQTAGSLSQSAQVVPKAKLNGTVVLSIVVGSNGDVEQARVVRSSSVELDKNATDAVATWKFHPARKNGLPVPVLLDVEVNFHLY